MFLPKGGDVGVAWDAVAATNVRIGLARTRSSCRHSDAVLASATARLSASACAASIAASASA